MSNEPVAWMFQHEETGRMSYVSNDGMNTPALFLNMNPRYTMVCVLYGNPVDDTALLRQALDCLENHVMQRTYASGVVICNTAIALRERLGEKT
jgi:hypothetical protein